MKITISTGIYCPPLSVQLKGMISEKDGKVLDKINEDMTELVIFSLLTESEREKVWKRIMKKVQQALVSYKNERSQS